MTKTPEIQPDIWTLSQLITVFANPGRRPTTDATSRISATSAPVLLMYDGLLFTLLKLRAMTTIVESRAGTMTATSKPGCLPESPISKLLTDKARESFSTLTNSHIALCTIRTSGPQHPRIRLTNVDMINALLTHDIEMQSCGTVVTSPQFCLGVVGSSVDDEDCGENFRSLNCQGTLGKLNRLRSTYSSSRLVDRQCGTPAIAGMASIVP
jgi:hypothetical protein